jgi:hypothetical protein
MKYVVIIATCIIAGLITYVFCVLLATYLEEKARPREAMFLCHKHGAIRKDHLIFFAGTEYCPICFHERLTTAEEIK